MKSHITRDAWRKKNSYFHELDKQCIKNRLGCGNSVLEIGCWDGALLAELPQDRKFGVDRSSAHLSEATGRNGLKKFQVEVSDFDQPTVSLGTEKFDLILLHDVLSESRNLSNFMANIVRHSHSDTRLLIVDYSRLWRPILEMATLLKLRRKAPRVLNMDAGTLELILKSYGYEILSHDRRFVLTKQIPLISDLLNFIFALPLLNKLCLRHYTVAVNRRLENDSEVEFKLTSVIVPCKNESGNIRKVFEELMRLDRPIELIFVEGGSSDETREVIDELITENQHLPIMHLTQSGRGKANAVWEGFRSAGGDLLVIYDADMTVPPESLVSVIDQFNKNNLDFVNCTRLLYPLESNAMQYLNYFANRLFAEIFRWITGVPVTDTLCGTKAIRRSLYLRIEEDILRAQKENLADPFGDFELLYQAVKKNLRISEVPVWYRARTFGTTQILRFRHGLILFLYTLRMWAGFLRR